MVVSQHDFEDAVVVVYWTYWPCYIDFASPKLEQHLKASCREADAARRELERLGFHDVAAHARNPDWHLFARRPPGAASAASTAGAEAGGDGAPAQAELRAERGFIVGFEAPRRLKAQLQERLPWLCDDVVKWLAKIAARYTGWDFDTQLLSSIISAIKDVGWLYSGRDEDLQRLPTTGLYIFLDSDRGSVKESQSSEKRCFGPSTTTIEQLSGRVHSLESSRVHVSDTCHGQKEVSAACVAPDAMNAAVRESNTARQLQRKIDAIERTQENLNEACQRRDAFAKGLGASDLQAAVRESTSAIERLQQRVQDCEKSQARLCESFQRHDAFAADFGASDLTAAVRESTSAIERLRQRVEECESSLIRLRESFQHHDFFPDCINKEALTACAFESFKDRLSASIALEVDHAIAVARKKIRDELMSTLADTVQTNIVSEGHGSHEHITCARETSDEIKERIADIRDALGNTSRQVRLASSRWSEDEQFLVHGISNGFEVFRALDDSGKEQESIYRNMFSNADGLFELCEDESSYEDGVLTIFLKKVPAKRMKLGRRSTSILEQVVEDDLVKS